MVGVPRVTIRRVGVFPLAIAMLAVAGAVVPGVLGFSTVLQVVAAVVAMAGVAAAWVVNHLLVGRNQRKAECYLDALSRMDFTELLAPDLDTALPRLNATDRLTAVLRRVRDAMVGWAHRVKAAEQSRASAELRLRTAQIDHDQIRAILDSIRVPVLAVNTFGEITLANTAANDLLTLPSGDVNRLKCQDCLANEVLVDVLLDVVRRKVAGQRTVDVELAQPDGTRRSFQVTCRMLSGQAELGNGPSVVAVFTDASDHKATQKRHAEFVSAVSHEMKTPLAGIRAYVELLADGDVEDEATREEFLNVINGQVDRLQRLIDNLLNLARIEAGVVEVHKRVLSANEVLSEAFQVVQPAAERKKIDFRSELSSMHLPVLADRDMLLQAAINLLSNAVKYTPDGGRVTLRSRLDDSGVVFEVHDTGVGLSPEDTTKVFEKFYRVKKDSQMASGTGLGLPLAKHIVEDVHGGVITVESQLGKGSTFRVTLPLCRSD